MRFTVTEELCEKVQRRYTVEADDKAQAIAKVKADAVDDYALKTVEQVGQSKYWADLILERPRRVEVLLAKEDHTWDTVVEFVPAHVADEQLQLWLDDRFIAAHPQYRDVCAVTAYNTIAEVPEEEPDAQG